MFFNLFLCVDSAKDVELPKVEKKREVIEPEEVTTVMKGKVRVFPTGEVHIVTKESELKRKRKLKIGQTARFNAKRRKPNGPKAKGTVLKKQKKVLPTKSKAMRAKSPQTGKTKKKA